MSRAFIVVNETNPNAPKLELVINGHSFGVSEHELHKLVEEAQWALGVISGARLTHWSSLVEKYVEAKNASK